MYQLSKVWCVRWRFVDTHKFQFYSGRINVHEFSFILIHSMNLHIFLLSCSLYSNAHFVNYIQMNVSSTHNLRLKFLSKIKSLQMKILKLFWLILIGHFSFKLFSNEYDISCFIKRNTIIKNVHVRCKLLSQY